MTPADSRPVPRTAGARWRSPRALAAAWLLARGAVFLVWWLVAPSVQGDVKYYWQRQLYLAALGPENTMYEYPTPVIWILRLPFLASGGSQTGYVIAFITLMLLLDVSFAVILWRSAGPRRAEAVAFWIAFTALLGPTVYMRFDLIPAVLVGSSLLALAARRTALTGALTALGAALKLWPALLWPATLLGGRRANRANVIAFFATGGTLALAALAYGGWDRLLSPIAWQSDRGLQVESLWASVPMAARAFVAGQYGVALSTYQAFEIAGPSVDAWLALATVASVAGILAAGLIYLCWFRRGGQTAQEAALVTIVVVAITIATNKTFSPQYMMWLGGPVAALLSVSGEPSDAIPWSRVRVLAYWVLGLTLLTFSVYPLAYEPLVHGGFWLGAATALLVIRNAAFVAFLVWLFRELYALLREWLASHPKLRRFTEPTQHIWDSSAIEDQEQT